MKSILVHVDASARSAERVKLALALARDHDAELTTYYGVLPAMLAMPWAVASTLDPANGRLFDEDDRRHRDRARELVVRMAGSAEVRWTQFDDEYGDGLAGHFARKALTADLLVLGQQDPDDREAGAVPADLVPALIVDRGKPTLVVPASGRYDAKADAVLLAWKSTREAARAAAAALPWLTRARAIHIAVGEEAGKPADFAALEHWLRLHGAAGSVERHSLPDIDIGEALLSLAADVDAGVLAMGCYGHSRSREWILGGATRTVLRAMTVPTLMVH